MGQNSVINYSKAIQAQLVSVVNPVPVYNSFNRNFATTPQFVVWMLRNVHQPVYTGIYQQVKGIDRPIVQLSIFTQKIEDGFTISQQVLQSLHGYSGLFGGLTFGFNVSKVDCQWLYNTYNNTEKLSEIFIDMTLDIPT